MKFQTILNEYSTQNMDKVPEGERLPSSSEISEIVTVADVDEKLSPEEQEKIEMQLEKIAETLYKKGGNNEASRIKFMKETQKILKKQGIKLNSK
jgi:hypothetical protein